MKKTVITISRQFGSGGHLIGEQLAKNLNIPFYDNNLLSIAAKETGMSEEAFKNVDETATNSFLYSSSMGLNTYSQTFMDTPLNDKLFGVQADIIQKVSHEGSCVIVGRCSDYILRNNPNCINLFIHADMYSRVQRITSLYDVPQASAENFILKMDKKRTHYYNYYTTRKWAEISNYHLSINSSVLGIDNTVKFIEDFIKAR